MITRLLVLSSIALFGITAPAHAGKGKKGKKGPDAGVVLARFDRDNNGKIDGKEATRLAGLYAALATLDTDKDGKLSESELAAAKIDSSAAAKGGKKKKAK